MIGGPTNLIENLFAAALIGGGAMAANAGIKGLQSQRREEGKSGILGGRPGDLSPEQLKGLQKQLQAVSQVGVQNYANMINKGQFVFPVSEGALDNQLPAGERVLVVKQNEVIVENSVTSSCSNNQYQYDLFHKLAIIRRK